MPVASVAVAVKAVVDPAAQRDARNAPVSAAVCRRRANRAAIVEQRYRAVGLGGTGDVN